MTGIGALILPLLAAAVSALAVLLWTGGSGTGPQTGGEAAGSVAKDQEHAQLPVRARVTHLVRRLRTRSADRAVDVELQVLEGLAAALEAGLPVPRAVTLAVSQVDAGEAGSLLFSAWDELARAATDGQALVPVWQRLARRTGSPTLASVARAWRVAAVTGAPLARAIRVSTHASRERRRLERAVQVATAGARATVTVLTLLPFGGVALAAVLGVSPLALYSHPIALASVAAGAVLVLVGQVWSRRMVARVLLGTS